MTSSAETANSSSGLERRFQLTVAMTEIDKAAQQRLQRISKSVKMPGFRPGKVPMKVVAQTYGAQAQSEAIGDVVSKAYSDMVIAQNLRVVGPPSIEPVAPEGENPESLTFEAVVEVFPEIQIPDLSSKEIKKTVCEITPADLDRTFETLRKQQTRFAAVERASQKSDQVTVDFKGEIDGVEFPGGASENFKFILGDGSMLKEFDEAATGMSKGETKSFPLKFPDDYHGKEVAGKLATFTMTLRDVAAPEVPELNEAFAKSLGVESGDINKLREDVEKNLRREVTARCKAKVKNSVMEALLETADFGVPKAMIETESQRLADNARKDLAARGMNVKDAPIPPELFKDQAAKRVRLGLLVAEVVKQKNLKAAEEQVRAFVEDLASSYESPGEFVNWYLGDANRRAEAEAVVIEENVVNWVLGVAKVTDDAISVETLLLQTAQAQA